MALSQKRRKELRAIGHNLNPVVTVAGKGLSEAVLAELDRALEDHELIKVKLAIGDRDARKQISDDLLSASKSELIQSIGKILLIYRRAQEPGKKSNLQGH